MSKAIIYWKIDGKEGHGELILLQEALSWVKAMNKKYGAGTHWIKEEVEPQEESATYFKEFTEV